MRVTLFYSKMFEQKRQGGHLFILARKKKGEIEIFLYGIPPLGQVPPSTRESLSTDLPAPLHLIQLLE